MDKIKEEKKKILDPVLVDKAMLWYKHFICTIKEEGIDTSNPYALGKLSVLQDVDPGFAGCRKEDSRFAIFDALQGCPFAFMETDEKGRYLQEQNEGENAADWIIRSMKRVTGITLGHMVKLYQAAKENRLVLRKCDPSGLEAVSCKYLKVASDGSCGITRSYIPLDGDEAVGLLFADGYSDDQVDMILARGEALEAKAAGLKSDSALWAC